MDWSCEGILSRPRPPLADTHVEVAGHRARESGDDSSTLFCVALLQPQEQRLGMYATRGPRCHSALFQSWFHAGLDSHSYTQSRQPRVRSITRHHTHSHSP